ncbi:MAG: hydroxyacid dehydrogenase [Halobacteriaceae archaeon]
MSEWQVLVDGPIDDAGPDAIADFASCTLVSTYADRAAVVEDAERYDAVVVRTWEVDRAFLEAATNLRVVAKHGAGLDNVDIPAASERGVVVANTPGVNARSVAEHTVTLLLAVQKSVRPADIDVHDGEWDRGRYDAHEVAGDVLGLFGCGDIGTAVSEMARGLGMDVLVYDPYLAESDIPAGAERVTATRSLFDRADAVSVHTPLTEETRGAIGRAELRALDGGVVVNTARGGVVDEEALVAALRAGEVAGAGLDVFASEPPADDDPLLAFRNVVTTPHVAGATDAAMRRMALGAAENVRTVYEGGLPESTVNADALDPTE